jgi:hypothetical protein
MARRQLVILSRESLPDGGLAPLGRRRDIESGLATRNTAAERPGGHTLYGPGIELELAPGQDPVTQMMLTISDEDIAWPVIMRLARELQWKILDPNSGRELSP